MIIPALLAIHIAAMPIDHLHLCQYQADLMSKTDEDNEPGTGILQFWVEDFLPPRDECGRFILPK